MASSPTANAAPRSYILSVKPVDYSLTAGTNIPAPLDSPPITPVDSVKSRPPTSGGGPLTSHPTRQLMPGTFPPSPQPEKENMHSYQNSTSTTSGADSTRDRSDSLLQQSPPMNMYASPPGLRRPSGVRRIFSMSSLRQSFNSSRTSLSQRPGSSYQDFNHNSRGEAPSVYSSYNHTASPTSTSMQPPPAMNSLPDNSKLRKKRSSSWFRRQSGFFGNNDEGMLDVVSEDVRGNKRMKGTQLPMLPEISTLMGDEHMEGSLGWDEGMFKR